LLRPRAPAARSRTATRAATSANEPAVVVARPVAIRILRTRIGRPRRDRGLATGGARAALPSAEHRPAAAVPRGERRRLLRLRDPQLRSTRLRRAARHAAPA